MGDLPKPPDDATWSDVERTFFDAAPPEELQPVVQAAHLDESPAPAPESPRSQIMGWLRPPVVGARRAAVRVVGAAGGLVQRGWRRTALTVVAAGVRIRDRARAGAEASLAAVLSIWCVDRRRLASAMAGVLIAAGLSAGLVASRGAAPTMAATAQRQAPATGPTVAEAAPVAVPPFEADPGQNARPPADVQAPRADVPNRRSHTHRRAVPAATSTQRPMVTAFVDRETYWAHEGRSTPARSGRSFFSR